MTIRYYLYSFEESSLLRSYQIENPYLLEVGDSLYLTTPTGKRLFKIKDRIFDFSNKTIHYKVSPVV